MKKISFTEYLNDERTVNDEIKSLLDKFKNIQIYLIFIKTIRRGVAEKRFLEKGFLKEGFLKIGEKDARLYRRDLENLSIALGRTLGRTDARTALGRNGRTLGRRSGRTDGL